MSIELYNTLTREREEFQPLEEGTVKFYSCGQTIYDDLHVGNARAYVFWDTLRRYLEWKGYEVRHVQNITDVGHLTDDADQGEDKVEKRAEELGIEPMELVEEQIERYFEDTEAINVERQDIVPRATGHINEMISFIERILENGYAYEVDGNVYFDVEKFAADHEYGKMAGKDLDQLKEEAESRVEEDERKRNQYDFALWLNAEGTGHLMRWESPWGEGYPGWHIECSVMGTKYLDVPFDIHAGGKDHIFPHHPNERSQTLAATGEEQAKFWLHNEFITVEGEKMSKSEGNFYTVRELLEEFSGDGLRLYLVSSHYRSETDFSLDELERAEKELAAARKAYRKSSRSSGSETLEKTPEELEQEFKSFMDSDLNTARAKQSLMEAVRLVLSAEESGEGVDSGYAEKLRELFGLLGVELEPELTDTERELADLSLKLRERFRESKDFETADMIRESLQELGFEVEDSEEGPEWFRG